MNVFQKGFKRQASDEVMKSPDVAGSTAVARSASSNSFSPNMGTVLPHG